MNRCELDSLRLSGFDRVVSHQSDMVSLGLVQGCFKMYWGLFRIGLRVGVRFLQGFLMVRFRVY